jgi:hypothetical protein
MAKTVADLKVGDTAVFEAAYGPERVTEIVEMWVGGIVNRTAGGAVIGEPFAPRTSTPWTMRKLGVKHSTFGLRFILRFPQEPVSERV